MSLPYRLARPLLFRMDAETAHRLTLKALRAGIVPAAEPLGHASLRVSLWNRQFPNPIGLAAGFDKNAAAIYPLLRLGFGFVEAGTVTPRPQEGNPRPRVFRSVDDEAVINRMGFPNEGLLRFKENIEAFAARKPRPAGVVGINIGMNKEQTDPARDYTLLVRHLAPYADYLTINISSPNTPGLRDLQKKENLAPLLSQILQEREKSCGTNPPPLLLKLAPDLDRAQQEEIAGTVLESGIDGLILANTTLMRLKTLPASFAAEKGGLSGRPLTDKSTDIVRGFYRLTNGRIPIIGCGGVSSAEDAYAKIKAGASLVQLYSALVFHGPSLVRDIQAGLSKLLMRDGHASVADAVGADHR